MIASYVNFLYSCLYRGYFEIVRKGVKGVYDKEIYVLRSFFKKVEKINEDERREVRC